jgi:thiol-disulfide isomerase/thioredoxin
MRRRATEQLVALVSILTLAGTSLAWAAGGTDQSKTASGASSYMPPDNYSAIQLKGHIERLQKVPLTQRQTGYSEAMVATADKILDSKPTDSLREFAILNLLDSLHYWADTEKNAEADKRLAELATKYSTDSNKKIANLATFYALEQRVLKPEDLAPADVSKLLNEVKIALTGKTLSGKYLRIATGTSTLINYLDTDEEAEKRFKEFSHVLTASTDQGIVRVGNQMRTAKRDPTIVKKPEKTADMQAPAQAANPEPAQMRAPQKPVELAEPWVKRVESQLAALSGNVHDEEYQKEKAAFLEKYPSDPLRWRWNVMDARRAMASGGSREENTQKARAVLAEVVSAGDASEELREQASTMNLRLDIYNAQPATDLARDVAEHLQKFPNSQLNASLMVSLILGVTRGQTEEQAIAALQPLKDCETAPLAAAAATRIAELENLIALKAHPLPLKFTAADGQEFDLQKYHGKVVLIDFWATWCGPCVEGLPEVIELHKKYHDRGFEIVGISFDTDKEALNQFVQTRDMPWVQFFDGKGWENQYGKQYGIHAIPAMWLIGRDGRIVDFDARTGLAQKIEKLMENPQAAAVSGAAPDKS